MLASASSRRVEGYLTGRLLAATAAIDGTEFVRTVVYVCAHTHQGAVGLTVNRPLENVGFADMLRRLSVVPNPPKRNVDVRIGGPNDTERGFVLHSADFHEPGTLRLAEDVALSCSLGILHALANGGGPQRGLLVLGNICWGAGGLEKELAAGAWLAAPGQSDILFEGDDRSRWSRTVRSLGVDPARLSPVTGNA
jgi:putative transcriptional regulator